VGAQERLNEAVNESDRHRAKVPHEWFLANLIGNHILIFVVILSLSAEYRFLAFLIPVISVLTLGYILWRARRSLRRDPWFVQAHWQASARYARVLLVVLGVLLFAAGGAWLGHNSLGMRPEAAWALVGGIGILPTCITVMVLIMLSSDLCAQLVGGLGFAASGNIGDDYAVFEPTHGSAPKYASMNKVNPIAMILSACMMLEWLGEGIAAARVKSAVSDTITEGNVRTYDMGGSNSTSEMAEAIAARARSEYLGSNPDSSRRV